MPAGLPYFAWIDAGETTFGAEHMRWDENVFSFTLEQSEGDPANLTAVVRRPRNEAGDPVGLLGPGRKIWAWFAIDCGPALFKFRGRLVGIPTSIFEELVTLEFVARPFDVVVQKEALADTLRVLPYYDEVVIDPARRTDPDVVLEGYTAVWHYDRETHALTLSDEIAGEDGTVEFDGTSVDGKVLYGGLGLTLTSGPLSRVDVTAEYTWTQLADGSVDLTNYLVQTLSEGTGGTPGVIVSYTFSADQWPTNGTSIGDGWEVTDATAIEQYDTQTTTKTTAGEITVIWGDGAETNVKRTETVTTLPVLPPGSHELPRVITAWTSTTTYATDGDGNEYAASFSENTAWERDVLVPHHVKPTLKAGYSAQRECTELVSFSLFADVQHILTDPEDGEALLLDGIRSVNLSEPADDSTGAEIPIGDPRRRSYIATPRGLQSLEHLIALARAHLMKRARVVEIAVAPKLSRMPEITLRKNVLLNEPRIGEALGKVIGYSISLDGSSGVVNCELRIGCTIGRGGVVVPLEGTPTYCSIEYTGADYQQFTGRTVLFDGTDASLAYEPPNAAPDDDGIEFLSVLRSGDVIEDDMMIENPPSVQIAYIEGLISMYGDLQFGMPEPGENREDLGASRVKAVKDALAAVPTRAIFRLKSMSREFTTNYDLQVTELKIPIGYDLEAV